VLTVDRWPELRDPLLVVALRGWVDAGFAGEGAADALREQLSGSRTFAHIDLTDVLDLQQTRPVARFVEGGLRVITFPAIRFSGGRAGRDVVVVHGPESSLRWPEVAQVIVGAARRVGAVEAVTLGAMPALVSHRGDVPVLATATSRALAHELGPVRADYAGPTGLQTVVQHELGLAGIPCAGFWAQVPQYVSGSPSPPAIRSLLRRVAARFRVELDLRPLDAQCDAYVTRVETGLATRPDVAEVVEQLDRAGPSAAEPSGDELVTEIERFLRDQD
jgi:hypothetical protein